MLSIGYKTMSKFTKYQKSSVWMFSSFAFPSKHFQDFPVNAKTNRPVWKSDYSLKHCLHTIRILKFIAANMSFPIISLPPLSEVCNDERPSITFLQRKGITRKQGPHLQVFKEQQMKLGLGRRYQETKCRKESSLRRTRSTRTCASF